MGVYTILAAENITFSIESDREVNALDLSSLLRRQGHRIAFYRLAEDETQIIPFGEVRVVNRQRKFISFSVESIGTGITFSCTSDRSTTAKQILQYLLKDEGRSYLNRYAPVGFRLNGVDYEDDEIVPVMEGDVVLWKPTIRRRNWTDAFLRRKSREAMMTTKGVDLVCSDGMITLPKFLSEFSKYVKAVDSDIVHVPLFTCEEVRRAIESLPLGTTTYTQLKIFDYLGIDEVISTWNGSLPDEAYVIAMTSESGLECRLTKMRKRGNSIVSEDLVIAEMIDDYLKVNYNDFLRQLCLLNLPLLVNDWREHWIRMPFHSMYTPKFNVFKEGKAVSFISNEKITERDSPQGLIPRFGYRIDMTGKTSLHEIDDLQRCEVTLRGI